MNTRRVTVGVVVQYIVLTLVFILLAGPLVWELSLAVKGPNDTCTPCRHTCFRRISR